MYASYGAAGKTPAPFGFDRATSFGAGVAVRTRVDSAQQQERSVAFTSYFSEEAEGEAPFGARGERSPRYAITDARTKRPTEKPEWSRISGSYFVARQALRYFPYWMRIVAFLISGWVRQPKN